MALTLLLALLLVVGHLLDQVEHLSHQLLLDGLEGGVLRQLLAGDLKRESVAVHDTSNEGEVPVAGSWQGWMRFRRTGERENRPFSLGDEVRHVIADEDATHIELEAGLRGLVVVLVVKVVGRGRGDEEHRLELNVALGLEVAVREGLVVGLRGECVRKQLRLR